jgi:hypothetical protein
LQIFVNAKEEHRRIIKIIETFPKEEILLELLSLNDNLYNTLLYYQQYAKTGKKIPLKKEEVKEVKQEKVEKKEEDDFNNMFLNMKVEESKNTKKLNLDELLNDNNKKSDILGDLFGTDIVGSSKDYKIEKIQKNDEKNDVKNEKKIINEKDIVGEDSFNPFSDENNIPENKKKSVVDFDDFENFLSTQNSNKNDNKDKQFDLF